MGVNDNPVNEYEAGFNDREDNECEAGFNDNQDNEHEAGFSNREDNVCEAGFNDNEKGSKPLSTSLLLGRFRLWTIRRSGLLVLISKTVLSEKKLRISN